MEQTPKNIAEEIKENLVSYIDLKGKIFKLSAYENIAQTTAILTYGLIFLTISLFTILFIFVTLGLILGTYLNSFAGGFAIVSALYLLILALIFINRKKLKELLIEKILTILTANDQNNEQSDNNANQ